MAKRKEVAGEAHKSKPLRVLELGAPRRKYTCREDMECDLATREARFQSTHQARMRAKYQKKLAEAEGFRKGPFDTGFIDRNITLVGRVLSGIELLSTMPRGAPPMGFYEKPEQRAPIVSIKLASEKLGYAKPGETVIRFEEATNNVAAPPQ